MSDPRPPKRIKDTDALRRFRLANQGEPCFDCELRPGVHVHHIVFRSQSGNDEPENLAWLCQICHDARHGIGV
jgi:5-methylcytosine-specific restriction endonuclease McrA